MTFQEHQFHNKIKIEVGKLFSESRQRDMFSLSRGMQIYPLEWLEPGHMFEQRGKIYISSQDMYKFIFIDGDISIERINFAIEYGMNRVSKKIDLNAAKYLR